VDVSSEHIFISISFVNKRLGVARAGL
jgi:hypothetical protein